MIVSENNLRPSIYDYVRNNLRPLDLWLCQRTSQPTDFSSQLTKLVKGISKEYTIWTGMDYFFVGQPFQNTIEKKSNAENRKLPGLVLITRVFVGHNTFGEELWLVIT